MKYAIIVNKMTRKPYQHLRDLEYNVAIENMNEMFSTLKSLADTQYLPTGVAILLYKQEDADKIVEDGFIPFNPSKTILQYGSM